MERKKQYKKGHFMGIGMAVGVLFGLPIGIAMGNVALGPAIGLPIGLALGAGLEQKYNPDPLPTTEEDAGKFKKWSIIGIAIGTLLAAALAIVYFMYR